MRTNSHTLSLYREWHTSGVRKSTRNLEPLALTAWPPGVVLWRFGFAPDPLDVELYADFLDDVLDGVVDKVAYNQRWYRVN